MNACLMPVLAADGCHVTTVEGIGTVKNDNLHPIQNAMVDMHGSQCGKFSRTVGDTSKVCRDIWSTNA